jgi:hypothetical protein
VAAPERKDPGNADCGWHGLVVNGVRRGRARGDHAGGTGEPRDAEGPDHRIEALGIAEY